MVDPELFARYQQALGTNADLTKKAVEELLAKLDGLTQLEQAEYLMANYPKLVRAYGKVAADVARQYYQESRDAHFEGDDDATEYTAQAAPPVQERWAAEDVRKAAQDGLGYLPKVAVRRVMQRADQTLAYNVRHDTARGRWAIVPHPGACGWCIMVASNGWAYSERSVNAQRHDGCKCSVAVDFDRDNPSLVGYNPKAMQQAYVDAYDTVRDDLQRHWDTLPDEKKAKYLRKGGRGFDGFRRDQIVAEMNRRNRDWLQVGKPVGYLMEKGASPNPGERKMATWLGTRGLMSLFRSAEEGRNTGNRTSDIYFVSGKDNATLVPWEFKQPTGDGRWTIYHQFEDAAGQAHKLVIDTSVTESPTSGPNWNRELIEDEARKLLGQKFTIPKGTHKGEPWEFDEVLLVSGTDYLMRIQKGG